MTEEKKRARKKLWKSKLKSMRDSQRTKYWSGAGDWRNRFRMCRRRWAKWSTPRRNSSFTEEIQSTTWPWMKSCSLKQTVMESMHIRETIFTRQNTNLRAWGTSSGKFYADIEICNREYQPHLFNQPEPDGIKCGGICRHTQAGVCLKILLQTINQ